MEARQFDTVVKTLGHGTSRRRRLRGLLAGVGGSALVPLTRSQAMAGDCGKDCAERRQELMRECRAVGPKCRLVDFSCTSSGSGICFIDPGACLCRLE